jgi:glycosyltransferase involved in cell wall biosynthesis
LYIIHLNASYKPAYIYGGPTMSVSKLCETLVRTLNSTDELEVITTTANGRQELPIAALPQLVDGVRVTYFPRLTKDHTHFSPQLLKGLKRTIAQHKKEGVIVHIHAWWNLVSMLGCLVALRNGARVIVSPRGMLTSYTLGNRNSMAKRLLHSFLGLPLLRRCSFHATSEKEREDIAAIIPVRIQVIPNLVDFPTHVPRVKGNDTQQFKLVYLSRIEQKKGLELLFSALSGVTFEWQLSIGGSGEETYTRQLQQLAKQLKIDDRINWLGQVENQVWKNIKTDPAQATK